MTLHKILVANRGEIARRIIRTCDKLGIETVAIYSDVDKNLPFVREATYAVPLGANEAIKSYLNIPKILEICKEYKIDAVHPGYGFLSENPDFAETLEKNGIIFIGPSPLSIRQMGSKSHAKEIATSCGIPTIEGYKGKDQTLSRLQTEANNLGYPILIKATHGGGGKGMRRVDKAEEFENALGACQREAQSAFGNPEVMLEKYIPNPRHVEIQLFGDTYGGIITIGDRDCSLQRRHQKVIEEAPAAGLSPALRDSLHRDALALGKAVSYKGAGTVEFLVSGETYYFLEMNTRLQVEHPVTESVYGVDLVALQIQVAMNSPLPQSLKALTPTGHALEARLYAEDHQNGFLPSTGSLRKYSLPHSSPYERIDGGYEEGNQVTIYYDPLLAKLIVWGEDRKKAYHHLATLLSQTSIQGVKTNRDFLLTLALQKDISDNFPSITYLDESMVSLVGDACLTPEIILLLGIGLIHQRQQHASKKNPWHLSDGWRPLGDFYAKVHYKVGGKDHTLIGKNTQWILDGELLPPLTPWNRNNQVGISRTSPHEHQLTATILPSASPEVLSLRWQDKVITAFLGTPDLGDVTEGGNEASLQAPMPGRIIAVLATPGEKVEEGAPLMILEAMKMEHTIKAPHSGMVEDISFSQGEFVEEGIPLAKLKRI